MKNEGGGGEIPKEICRHGAPSSFCSRVCYGTAVLFSFLSLLVQKNILQDMEHSCDKISLWYSCCTSLGGKKLRKRKYSTSRNMWCDKSLRHSFLIYILWSHTFRRIICCKIVAITLTNQHSTKMAMLQGGRGRLQGTPVCAVSHTPSVRSTYVPVQGFWEVRWTSV